VLLTDTPIPAVDPSEFNEMVRIEQAPGPVQRFVGETVSISRLPTTTDDEPWKEFRFNHLMKEDGDDDTNEKTDTGSLVDGEVDVETESLDSQTDQTATFYKHTINTGLGATLYKLSAFVYITRRIHRVELQRFATVLSTVDEPFSGASALLKGNNEYGDYSALRAAAILDTLMHENKTNRLERLATAGFEVARPEANRSNYEYERLFRVSRDALSDGLSERATRSELVDIVTGDVMKAAARARTDDPDERWLREPAESFAQVFIGEIFSGICDGDFHELRRLENHLAAGYNAAMRRKRQAWREEYKNTTDSANDTEDRVDESDAEEQTE
jgi:CRISPR type I-D-associated protein Csc3/Cas10d